MTRAVKVEAFSSWSACRMSRASISLASSFEGTSPVTMCRKFAEYPRSSRGGMTSWSCLCLCMAATMVAIFAAMDWAFSAEVYIGSS